MTILEKLVALTEKIEGMNGIAEAINKLKDAETEVDTAAAASQLIAELAVATVTTATIRKAMSITRLGLAVSGQIWKWEALSKLSGVAAGLTAGQIIDSINSMELGGKAYDIAQVISNTLGTDPDPLVRSVKYIPRTDPLVLDLDGDGFEITAVNRTPPILFDNNADTVKTATAWVNSDDGLLVLDRNGNGMIDSGRELFGGKRYCQAWFSIFLTKSSFIMNMADALRHAI